LTPGAKDTAKVSLLLIAALTALFPSLVIGGHVLFDRDVHQMLYGQYASFARALAAGGWPVWDAWSGFGQPMLANPAAQVLYPPTWLCLLLEPGPTYTVFVLAHLLVGGLATAVLARRLGVSTVAAAGSGVGWTLAGPTLSLVSLWHHLAGASLLPVVVLAADRTAAAPGLRAALAWGAAMGLQALAGSFDMCVLTAGVTAAWLVHRCITDPGGARARARALAPFGVVAGGFAACLAAPLLLPALDLWNASARAALSESVRTAWSVHPALLAQVAVPVFPQQAPLQPEVRESLFDGREPFMASLYLGLSAVPLLAASLFHRSKGVLVLLGGLFLAAALLSLGRHGIAYPAVVTLAPFLQSLRYPVKVTVVMAFAWSMLAGLGLEALARYPARTRWVAFGGGVAAMLGAGATAAALLASPGILAGPTAVSPDIAQVRSLLWPVAGALASTAPLIAAVGRSAGRSWVGIAGVFLLTLDLLQAHRGLNPTAPAVLFATPPPAVAHLGPSPATRIHAWDYASTILGKRYRRARPDIPRADAPRDRAPELVTALARQHFLSPPVAARFGLLGSYDRDWLGLQPRGVRNIGLAFQLGEETPDFLRLLRLAGVQYTVALHEEGLEELVPVATTASPFAGPVHVRRVPEPLPLAYVAGGVRAADGPRALQVLVDPAFDPRAEVILPQAAERPAAGPVGACSITSWRADRVEIRAEMAAPGLVVFLAAWDPAWRARVDGREEPVERANVAFLGVRVGVGSHVVELSYRPRGLAIGLGLAGGALAVAAALSLSHRPRFDP
jgi:hypothetical protein